MWKLTMGESHFILTGLSLVIRACTSNCVIHETRLGQLDVNLIYKVQTFELILIVGGALFAVMLLKFELGNTALRGSIAFCLAILASLQIYFEGHRWHMVGAYFAVAISLFLLIRGPKIRIWLAKSLAGI